jgi:cellulose biosynthesis protein BcsQ
MSKRIALFNHKGGVSKTTSAFNIGWNLARNHRVLLVDTDPQCNLTALILGEDFEKYYVDDETKNQNIHDGVRAAFEGKPSPLSAVSCKVPDRAPNLHLLAGHANLSEYDAALTFAQTSNNAITTLQNLPGAFNELLRLTEERYNIDYTIIDMNPSLSAINQNFFIISDSFIVPTNPDPFSIMALDTLSTFLPRWAAWSKNTGPLFNDSAYPLPAKTPKFLGTIIQRFNIRRGRAAKPFRDNIAEIVASTKGRFWDALSRSELVLDEERYSAAELLDGYCVAEIPDFQGLLPKAYNAGVPIFEVTDKEIGETGPVLAQMKEKRRTFDDLFTQITDKLVLLLKDE